MIYFHCEKWDTDEKKPWIAKITGVDTNNNLVREFVNGLNDYSGSRTTKRHTYDIEIQFVLRVGWVVEIASQGERLQSRKYYIVTSPTEKTLLSAKDLLEWATSQPALPPVKMDPKREDDILVRYFNGQ